MFVRLAPAALCLLFLAGCGPAALNVSKTLDLETDEARAIDLDAQSKPQKITVEFKSSEGDVSVFLFKEEDAKGDEGLLTSDPTKAIEKKKGKEDSFSADVPANTPVRVIVRGAAKKTKVDVKVTNK
jgi:hypothetical protein